MSDWLHLGVMNKIKIIKKQNCYLHAAEVWDAYHFKLIQGISQDKF